MKQLIRTFFLLIISFFSIGCSGKKAHCEETPGIRIIRVDTDLYNYLTHNAPDSVLSAHKDFLDVLGEKVIYIGKSDAVGFYEGLKKYFSEPTLINLFLDEQTHFADIETLNEELSYGLDILQSKFPQIKQPKVYIHVSGLNQNVIVTDEILSLSADKYLGADYPLYQNFFFDYQRQLMSPDRMTPDYLLGFMMANLPFKGNEDVLLDRILYEGKLRYILSKLLPKRQVWEYVGYSKEQYLWCSDNQKKIWKTILGNQHLFSSNYMTTAQYLKEAPHTAFLPEESPGKVGIWLGYQIIIAYMNQNHGVDFDKLMELTDYQELLKQSKYKP